jgi:hypothetical protein
MTGQAALHSSMTPMVLETVVAALLVAVLVALGVAVVYAVIAGSAAWVLMLVIGVLQLLWAAVRGAGRSVRARLHRAPARIPLISPESVPDLRTRPSG